MLIFVFMNPGSVLKSTSMFRPQAALFSILKTLINIFICVLFSYTSLAQDSITIEQTNKTALRNNLPDFSSPSGKDRMGPGRMRSRVKIIAATNIIGYGGAMIGLYASWYKNYPQSNFHVFNDIPEWKGMDKIGHAYGVYAESLASMELWRWTGISRKKRIWLGGLSGPVYHTVIEVLDAYSAQWGWSWGDIGANFIGSGILIAQELAWDEQRIQFKFSYHNKHYNDPALNKRSDELFGKSTAERFFKDYNGQTYWLSTNVRSFFPESNWPKWLNIAVGTGAEGLLGANENVSANFNRTDVKRYRQWYLSPDIDLTKIKTNKKGLKLAFRLLNIVKIPMPALEYSNGGFKVNAIGF